MLPKFMVGMARIRPIPVMGMRNLMVLRVSVIGIIDIFFGLTMIIRAPNGDGIVPAWLRGRLL